jgi:hypothetical protein
VVKVLVKATLALVLFSDASRIGLIPGSYKPLPR